MQVEKNWSGRRQIQKKMGRSVWRRSQFKLFPEADFFNRTALKLLLQGCGVLGVTRGVTRSQGWVCLGFVSWLPRLIAPWW